MMKPIHKKLVKALKNEQYYGKWLTEKDIETEIEPIIKEYDKNSIMNIVEKQNVIAKGKIKILEEQKK